MEGNIDDVGWRVLRALQDDARLSFGQLGRRVGLSAPAAAERVRRLEASGAIRGYGAGVDAARLGYGVTAFIGLRTERRHRQKVRRLVAQLPEVIECHHLSGARSFLIKLRAGSLGHLERLIDRFAEIGPTDTSIVLSTYLDGKPVNGPPAAP